MSRQGVLNAIEILTSETGRDPYYIDDISGVYTLIKQRSDTQPEPLLVFHVPQDRTLTSELYSAQHLPIYYHPCASGRSRVEIESLIIRAFAAQQMGAIPSIDETGRSYVDVGALAQVHPDRDSWMQMAGFHMTPDSGEVASANILTVAMQLGVSPASLMLERAAA